MQAVMDLVVAVGEQADDIQFDILNGQDHLRDLRMKAQPRQKCQDDTGQPHAADQAGGPSVIPCVGRRRSGRHWPSPVTCQWARFASSPGWVRMRISCTLTRMRSWPPCVG
ncbi:hypothetical protein KSAC_35030 (plasmid) [Komagataeibacter saccharivorans]|nr:hypothetical protein KSAC_35030 [Komagataeibacter saccharivorans]